MQIQKGDATSSEVLNNNEWSPNNYLGKCPSVAKFHDYFTTCLPSPQKGNPVEIGTVQVPSRVLPVTGLGFLTTGTDSSNAIVGSNGSERILALAQQAGYHPLNGAQSTFGQVSFGDDSASVSPLSYNVALQSERSASSGNSFLAEGAQSSASSSSPLYIDNLVAYDPGVALAAATVNDLRYAFQLQKMLEKDARGGSRYREYILSHFGVSVADARVQVPEFLGGKRTPLNVQQVAQMSQNTPDSPLASLGAYSLSFGNAGFSKGFTEHGYIIGCLCLRYHHTYQQGVERYAFRKDRLDFYDPVFANIGEQPVYKKELFASAPKDEVFGYQEAWADLRYRPSRVSGQLASKSTNTLDIYHFGDEYVNAPTLSEGFINETDSNFARTIAIDDAKLNDSDQFVFDIYIQNDAIRELPVYSVPSLIDHN
nr:MAG: major capsid protein [Gokushovirinae sp.]